jgi:tetraacyldisaccharide 4'-kinase
MEAQFHEIVSGADQRVMARLARPALAVIAGGYRLVISARNRCYDIGLFQAHRSPIPVVSIGNITLGGTGKTPFVEFVCRWFLDRGFRPAILSRGYGSDSGRNDEAAMLHANLPAVPHWQGKDRVELAQRIWQSESPGRCPDVLVLDDGFQHRRLARDLDIVLIDCTEPFGHGRMFPRGLLREPIQSLRRADIVVLSRSEHAPRDVRERIRDRIAASAGVNPLIIAEHRPTMLRSHSGATWPATALAGQSVAAFCGIGNPGAFRKTLEQLDCHVTGMRTFPDHHRYSEQDVAQLDDWAREMQPDFIVTTQKDHVKLSHAALADQPLVSLGIEVVIQDPGHFLDSALVRIVTRDRHRSRAA